MRKKTELLINKFLKLSESRQFDNHVRIAKFGEDNVTSYSNWPEEWKTVYYKAYPRFEQLLLPTPSVGSFDLYKSILNRKSLHEGIKKNIKLVNLSNLLYFSSGIKKITKKESTESRMHPSAGARYPLEIYPFIFNVGKITEGVYHYHLKTHSLETILKKRIRKQTTRQFHQPWIKDTSLLLVVSAVFDRSEMKYGDRSYRHIFTEYGHIAQNVYLVGTALGLGICSIGGFIDEGLNEIIDLDGITESVIGVIAVNGK